MMIGSTQAFLDFECFLHYILFCIVFSAHAFSYYWFLVRFTTSCPTSALKTNKANSHKKTIPKIDNVYLIKLKRNSMRANLYLLPCVLLG